MALLLEISRNVVPAALHSDAPIDQVTWDFHFAESTVQS